MKQEEIETFEGQRINCFATYENYKRTHIEHGRTCFFFLLLWMTTDSRLLLCHIDLYTNAFVFVVFQ